MRNWTVLLEAHVLILGQAKQFLAGLERFGFVLQRLAQDVADVVLVRFEQWTDTQ